MTTYNLKTPLSKEDVRRLLIGDEVYLSGTIYMARDAAHKRFVDALARGDELPVDLRGEIIFYGGPGPTKPGHVIGVVAPTSAYRMDPYATILFDYGVRGAIGKGNRGSDITDSCIKNCSVCFSAIGGISATLYSCIENSTIIAYEDLKTEAVQRLQIKNFPLLVTNDSYGGDMYKDAVERYRNLLS